MKTITSKTLIITFIATITAAIACKRNNTTTIPNNAIATADSIEIYPDYKHIVIPPNIAPLNFMITNKTKQAKLNIIGSINNEQYTLEATKNNTFFIPEKEWKSLLNNNKGGKITYTIYTSNNQNWYKHKQYSQEIALDKIDKCLSYRLIEPGYEMYRQLGIYQRDLETFEQKPIYINNRKYKLNENHCINCHTYQNYQTEKMLFHIRHTHGGTLFINKGKYSKIELKTDSTIGAGVYPAWHPKLNALIFSVNKTGQMFFTNSNDKIEVLDTQSDLIYYNVDKNELFSLGTTPYTLETFPTWNPQGDKLYYCAAQLPNDTAILNQIPENYNNLHYNLMARAFDTKTQTFGPPETIIDAAKDTLSITLPRISPDGKHLLFTIGHFGQFHIWHKNSDLGLLNLTNGQITDPKIINSQDVESWHSWSSNGRWITFSSRRDDGSFTRPYFAHFDTKGNMYKPFILPQEDPLNNIMLTLSYNLPTLTQQEIPYDIEEVTKQVKSLQPKQATYKGKK